MVWDFAWDFRATENFVTDPTYAVWVPAQPGPYAFPHTFTNVNGDSVDAGWVTIGSGAEGNGTASDDPRIAGAVIVFNGESTGVFRVDLSTGTAPGAGTYAIDIAMGRGTDIGTNSGRVKDNTTIVVDLTNGGLGYATVAAHYIDATGTDRSATTTWNGVTVNAAFSSTTVNLEFGMSGNTYRSYLAHFRLTQVQSYDPGAQISLGSYDQQIFRRAWR